MTDSYERLLSPGKIGKVTTRNRVIKTGAGVMMWHEDDVVMRDEVVAFYEAMARGGTGLIIVESPTVDYPASCRWRERYRLDDDKYIPGMAQIADGHPQARLPHLHADESRRHLAGQPAFRAQSAVSRPTLCRLRSGGALRDRLPQRGAPPAHHCRDRGRGAEVRPVRPTCEEGRV